MADEYIRIQDVVDEINTNADDLEQNGGIPYAQGARAMAIVVEQMSPADVAPVVHGEWLNAIFDSKHYRCSICNYHISNLVRENYCPNCGAKMDAQREE